MASSLGQTSGGDDFSTAVTTAATGSPTVTGSTFLVLMEWGSTPTFVSIADNKSNTYSQIGTEISSEGTKRRAYICQNGTGGAGHTVTTTISGNTGHALVFVEVKGVATSSQDQLVNFTADSASPFTSGTTGTTTQADEMAVVLYWINEYTATTITWGNGYSEAIKYIEGGTGTLAVGYKNLAATGTQQASVTLSAGTATSALIITLKDSGGGGGGASGRDLMLLGMGTIDNGAERAWRRESGSRILTRDRRPRVYSLPQNLKRAA